MLDAWHALGGVANQIRQQCCWCYRAMAEVNSDAGVTLPFLFEHMLRTHCLQLSDNGWYLFYSIAPWANM